MLARIFIGPPGCGRSSLLLEELRRQHRHGQALALTPTKVARAALQRAWQGGRDVDFHSIHSFARTLLHMDPQAGLPGGRNQRILSSLSRRLLLRRAWRELAAREQASLYEAYGDGPSALHALMPLFDLLATSLGSARPEALQVGPGASAELIELAQVYRRYLTLCAEHHLLTFQEIESCACDLLESPAAVLSLPWRTLVLDDLDAARPEQILLLRRFVEVLTQAGRRPAILASALDLENATGDAQRQLVLDLVAELGLEPVPVAPRPLPAGPLIARLCPAIPASGAPSTIIELDRPDAEAHAIAQTIAADLFDHPERRFADYAVICWNTTTLQVIRRVLGEYGVLASGAPSRPVAANPLTPMARAGAALLAGLPLLPELEHEFLRGPLRAVGHADAAAISQAHGGLLALLEERATVALTDDGHAVIATLSSALHEARAVPSFARRLLLWLERIGAGQLIMEDDEGRLPLDEEQRRACWRQIELALEHLEELEATAQRVGEPLAPADLARALDEALLLTEAEPEAGILDAVGLWDPDELHGRKAAVVFLAGLDEEALPRREPAIQPTTAEELLFAFGQLPAFALPQQQEPAVTLSRARRQLALALSRATERVILSYSSSSLDGRTCLPSPLFLDLLGPQAIAGERLHVPAASSQGPAPARLQRGLGANNPPLSFAPDALAAMEPAALLPHLELVGRLLDDNGGLAAPLPAARPPMLNLLASATHIRDYLTCPRRYYYARLLGLNEEEGERLALGQLFHAVVEQLWDEWEALASEQRLRRGLALFRKAWASYRQRLGPPLHQVSYRRLLRSGLAALIAYEEARVRRAGRRPIARERRFQLTWRDGSAIVGFIDRIDRLPDGRYAVIDYKTGSSNPSLRQLLKRFVPVNDDADWRPEDVQLPLYAFALEQGAVEGLPPGEVAEVSLLFPFEVASGTGKLRDVGWRRIQLVESGELSHKGPAATLPRAALERTWEEVDRVLAEMRSGPYPPNPRDERVCRSCPYRFSCPQPASDDEGAAP